MATTLQPGSKYRLKHVSLGTYLHIVQEGKGDIKIVSAGATEQNSTVWTLEQDGSQHLLKCDEGYLAPARLESELLDYWTVTDIPHLLLLQGRQARIVRSNEGFNRPDVNGVQVKMAPTYMNTSNTTLSHSQSVDGTFVMLHLVENNVPTSERTLQELVDDLMQSHQQLATVKKTLPVVQEQYDTAHEQLTKLETTLRATQLQYDSLTERVEDVLDEIRAQISRK